jgi:hypothetical protein
LRGEGRIGGREDRRFLLNIPFSTSTFAMATGGGASLGNGANNLSALFESSSADGILTESSPSASGCNILDNDNRDNDLNLSGSEAGAIFGIQCQRPRLGKLLTPLPMPLSNSCTLGSLTGPGAVDGARVGGAEAA